MRTAKQVDRLVFTTEQLLWAEQVKHLVQQWECPCERVRSLMSMRRYQDPVCDLVKNLVLSERVWPRWLVWLERWDVHAPLVQLLELRPELVDPEAEIDQLEAPDGHLTGGKPLELREREKVQVRKWLVQLVHRCSVQWLALPLTKRP